MQTAARDDLIETYFAALDTEEYDPLRDAFAPDVRYLYPGGEHLQGLEAVMAYFENRRPTRNSTHAIHRCIHAEAVSVTEGEFTGQVPETGPISADFCNVFEFDDDETSITYNAVYMRPDEREF